jgi:hypothetical protein
MLLPYCPYNYKIHLEANNKKVLKYNPLYKISLEELETIKEYLIENLSKGFIEPSQALFAVLVLFIKKPTSGLRFYIDFQILNTLICKDRYPLLLIDETLVYITNTKIFTKLDIR